MKLLIKLILLLAILGGVFAMGYVSGTTEAEGVRETLAAVQTQLSQKTKQMEEEMAAMRVRLHLMNARSALASAQNSLDRRNYGTMEHELKRAQETLRSAAAAAPPGDQAESLLGLEIALDEVLSNASAGLPIQDRLQVIKSDLEKILS